MQNYGAAITSRRGLVSLLPILVMLSAGRFHGAVVELGKDLLFPSIPLWRFSPHHNYREPAPCCDGG